MFGEWFCQNWYANCFTIATVVASGLISWVISAIYYRIGNRNNLKSSLPDDIEKIFNRYELEFEVDECENALKNLYIAYCKNYFSIQEISFFEEKKITKIIEESEITKEWNQRFQNLNNKKKEFLILKVARSTLRSDPCAQQRALH